MSSSKENRNRWEIGKKTKTYFLNVLALSSYYRVTRACEHFLFFFFLLFLFSSAFLFFLFSYFSPLFLLIFFPFTRDILMRRLSCVAFIFDTWLNYVQINFWSVNTKIALFFSYVFLFSSSFLFFLLFPRQNIFK